jgi:hypothetical protein
VDINSTVELRASSADTQYNGLSSSVPLLVRDVYFPTYRVARPLVSAMVGANITIFGCTLCSLFFLLCCSLLPAVGFRRCLMRLQPIFCLV